MTAKEELFDQLDKTRERLLVAIEWLPDEALQAPGAVGKWSVVDLLGILTSWEAEVVTGLMRLNQGKPPDRLLGALADPNAHNLRYYADNHGRDIEAVFTDFQSVRMHLEEWLEEFTEKALSAPGHYKPLSGRALGDVIAAATFENEARYVPFLESFAARWERDHSQEAMEVNHDEPDHV